MLKRIFNEKHKVGTYDLNKISLSCFDDKRFVLGDGINSLHMVTKILLIKQNVVKLSKTNYS